MPKLSQIVAIEKGVKTDSYRKLTEAHKRLQKTALLTGISRTYRPRDDDGEQLPPESTRVQLRAERTIQDTSVILGDLFDVTATKDWGNCEARADVSIDDEVLLPQVPVTYLLFLEKQLTDLKTFIQNLPVLDPSDHWSYDNNQDCWATPPEETARNKKVLRNHVKSEATEHHPAQVQVYEEPVVVGYWKTLKYSGSLPATRVNELLSRVEKLQQAVKFAREEANSTNVPRIKVGSTFFGHLFAT